MYAIIGATGNIGSKAAEILLARKEKVRVIGRDAAKLQRLVGKGAEAVVGNLKNTAFLKDALTGVDAVFTMIPPNYTATDFRIYQNEIGANIAEAVVRSGVKYVVNLSSQGAELPAGTGPILGLHDQEERLNALAGVHVLHLRCTYFMENLLMNIPLINEQGIAGSALRGNQKISMIATKDIAARVAECLVRRDFTGKNVLDLLGQRDLTLDEAIGIIGRKIGWSDLKYVQFPYEEARKGMIATGISPDVSRLFIEMSKGINEGLFAVSRPRTTENTTPTTIEEFAETFAAEFAATQLKKAA
ncbi:MAG: NmrA family NAD(P)-binding protein [Desulfuromonadaceae bacterium]|nr:NmrA family NAD(P)-binding protein [Desulfuromonadaceae bacterium]